MKSINERISHIRALVKEAEEKSGKGLPKTFTISNWQGKEIILPIIRIHRDYLMYRIENSRTFREQIGYLQDHPELGNDFFKDPENSSTQKAQEEILLKMIEDSRLKEEFLTSLEKHQDEPAIVTYQGYVVNGNRRTAAAKSLGIEYIECVVLPETATKKDIYTIEHLEQISEDFKEEYHWVNELNNYYMGIHDPYIKFDIDQMSKSFRTKRQDLESKLRMLDYVNEYLDWVGCPGNYDYKKLDYAEQIFIEIEKATRNKKFKDDIERQEFIKAIFYLIEEPPTKGRLYSHVLDIIKNWDSVYKKLKNDYVIENTNNNSNKNAKSENDSILNQILDTDNNSDEIEIFSVKQNPDKISGKILETIADVKAERKELTEAESVYESTSSALRELQNLVVNDRSIKLDSAKVKLEQIIKISNDLILQINEFEKHKNG